MIDLFERAAIAAGREIMQVFHAGPTIHIKSDSSPVTEADERAEAVILSALSAAFPHIPVVAEEAAAAGNIPETGSKSFILVDPLDGTKEFIRKSSDFTVNIALIDAGIPIMGVVYAPARGVAYLGDKSGAVKVEIDENFIPVARHAIRVRASQSNFVALASRSHNSPETDVFLKSKGISETKSVGSSLKFCLIAEGGADVYPRFGRTMEWDTAAGDAVLRAAGGITLGLDGLPLPYGKRNQVHDSDFANPSFIAWGGHQI
ncbi:3'(2'),5'-bisphosphate nucleotidase CysQ [Allorhizobium terrae]|uniref:3'(2'),5'-bisphosphate nucleotidase CysQ n=1 Tax=Allorhizobium terrae TaxID=1848972 RepID=A0A4S4A543_9HYPH|nr:3'(2'),5'-bisphosphate nucleotidase CysQ [Allorhizobium terrae]THF53641.1 3'(2'),5'-bisphosphate nucleotidase CysQ [Allorhizobium terrae]